MGQVESRSKDLSSSWLLGPRLDLHCCIRLSGFLATRRSRSNYWITSAVRASLVPPIQPCLANPTSGKGMVSAAFAHLLTLLALVSVIAACSDAPPSEGDRRNDRRGPAPDELIEELRIGSGDSSEVSEFSDIRGLVVDPWERLFLLEYATRQVRVFDKTGRFVRTIGRSGHGPGEFVDPAGIALDPAGNLWVVDQGASRYTIFDSSGTFLRTIRRGVGGAMVGRWQGGFDGNGRLVDVRVTVMPHTQATILFVDPKTGAVLDSLLLPPEDPPQFEKRIPNGTTRAFIPFAPRQVWTVDRRGMIWLGRGDRLHLLLLSPNGDTLTSVDRPDRPPPVSEVEKAEAFERLAWFRKQGGHVTPAMLPNEKPVFTRLFTDRESRLWVEMSVAATAKLRRFEVFDSVGRYLGKVQSPFEPFTGNPLIYGLTVYGVVADSIGSPSVVRARIPARTLVH